jgi:sterol desaturase/sphingolipid hydroxylase (fatty acid hydroxylase superfamily)
MLPQPIRLVIALFVVGIVITAIERLFPAKRKKPIWRKDSGLDVQYWFFTALVSKSLTKAVIFVLVMGLSFALGRHLGPQLADGFPPISNQPIPVIVLEVLVIGDFVSYWMHRAFHRGSLWKFHAIHHSSIELDWLSSVRLHPINEVVQKSVQILPFVILGFPAHVLTAYVPFLLFYAILIHANLDWDFGPLRYVIASPRFHRWHHTSEEEGLDKNFAGLFPLYDIIFGTFYMPAHATPKVFGVRKDNIPISLIGQLLHPFQKEWG